jgi:hypothetical protein
MTRIALAVVAMLAMSGCSTFFTASAASPDPAWQYVVGMRGQTPAVFLCPTTPGQQLCQRMQLVEQ